MFKIDPENQSIGLYVKGLTAAQAAMLADGAHKALALVLNERRMAEVDARLVADEHQRRVRKLKRKIRRLKEAVWAMAPAPEQVRLRFLLTNRGKASDVVGVGELANLLVDAHEISQIRIDKDGMVCVYKAHPELEGEVWVGGIGGLVGWVMAPEGFDWRTWGIDYDRTGSAVRVTVLPLGEPVPTAEEDEDEAPPLFQVGCELMDVDDLIKYGLGFSDVNCIRMDKNEKVYAYTMPSVSRRGDAWSCGGHMFLGSLREGERAIDWRTWGIDYDRTADPVRVTVLPLAADGEEVETPF